MTTREEFDGSETTLIPERRPEEILRESEERYRSLVQATAAIVWHTPASGEFTGAQPGWSGFTGQTWKEYSGHGWLDAIHPEDRERTLSTWQNALANRVTYEIEHRVRRHDGEWRTMVSRAVPILDRDGKPREWVGLHSDMTSEHRLRHELDEERERLRDIFMRAPAFIAVLTGPDLVFDFINPQYSQLIGHRDVVGKPVRVALPEIEGQGFFEIIENVFRTGEPYSARGARVELVRSNTVEPRFVNFVYEPMYSSGNVTGVFVHGTDVTDQVRAREDAEYGRQLVQTITDNAASCLFMMDSEGRPTFMNPAAVEVTGYQLEEIRHEPLHQAVHHHHPDGKPFPIADCPIDNGREQLVPLRDYRDVFVRKDGSFFPVSCHVAPLQRDGATIGAVLEFRDITDELRAQETLREADRRKDEFLATLSHELRTPLTAILGWARLLQLGWDDEETLRTAIDTIEKSARVQTQIVDDVLDISRIVSGKLHVASAPVHVASVVSDALEAVRLAATAKQITLESDHERNRAGAIILGDASRLQQVIWNLLVNAIKFTPVGGRVSVQVVCGESTVSVAVCDSGMGINPEFLPHVFETFRQAESSTTRTHGGLGLGLSIVRHLVELHGGTVQASSEGAGKGATFTIELPRLRQTAAEEATAALPEDTHLADLSGLSVLVIDDQESVRNYLAAVLQKCGARSRDAADVASAIRLTEQERPDLILCDLAMPGEDGFSFLKWLRASPLAHDVTVFAVTAFGRDEDRQNALDAGFDGYLRKPIQPGELSHAVANAAKR